MWKLSVSWTWAYSNTKLNTATCLVSLKLFRVIPRVTALRLTALRTYGHFELSPFPEFAALASELRLFSGMALPPGRLATTGVAVFSLFTNTVRFAKPYSFCCCSKKYIQISSKKAFSPWRFDLDAEDMPSPSDVLQYYCISASCCTFLNSVFRFSVSRATCCHNQSL
jgi:hypothetical protein